MDGNFRAGERALSAVTGLTSHTDGCFITLWVWDWKPTALVTLRGFATLTLIMSLPEPGVEETLWVNKITVIIACAVRKELKVESMSAAAAPVMESLRERWNIPRASGRIVASVATWASKGSEVYVHSLKPCGWWATVVRRGPSGSALCSRHAA